MKNTDDLIRSLSGQLQPVKVVRFTAADFLKVIAVGFFCLFAAIAISGLRIDMATQIKSVRFVLESLLLIVLSVGSIGAAFSLSVPSLESRRAYQIPLLVFSLILLSTMYSFGVNSDPFLYLGHGFSCVTKIISIALLPAAVLFYLVRRAAPLKRDVLGVCVLAAAVSFGLLGVQLTCADGTPLHLLFWHIVPSVAAMIAGIWLARKIVGKI